MTTKATCVEKGVRTYTCNDCGAKKTADIDPTGIHKWGGWVDDQNGTTHTHTCTVCGTNSETKDHTWDNGVVTTAPTCVEKGVKTYTCKDCGAKKTEDIDPTGVHKWGKWVDDKDGEHHTRTCTVCGTNKETEEHKWNAGVVTTAPTCVAKGVKTFTCTVCGGTKTEEIEPTGIHTYDNDCDTTCNVCGLVRAITHKYAEVWSSDGTNHWHACTVCGDKTDVAAHTPGPAATEKAPQTCTVCGYIITPAIKHIHKYSTTWTYTAAGHWHECEGCNDVIDYSKHVYDNDCDPTCNICGYTRKIVTHKFAEAWSSDGTSHWHVCTVCGLKADVAEHVPGKEATETEPQVCVVCGYVLKEALGHTHHFGAEWKSDETSHWHVCTSGDGATADKAAHIFSTWRITQKSADKNERSRYCTVCGYTVKEEYTPKTYNMISGGNSTWNPNSGNGLSVRSEAEVKDFVGVMVDGEIVDPKYYIVTEGSTIVTFTDEFLETLSEGTHTIAILSVDGMATTDVNVSTEPESTTEASGTVATTSSTVATTSTTQGGSSGTVSSGCGSFIGVAGTAAVIFATLGAAIVFRKKKED